MTLAAPPVPVYELADAHAHATLARSPIAWGDACRPFMGEEELRVLGDPEFPGIEGLPIRPRVATASIIALPTDNLARQGRRNGFVAEVARLPTFRDLAARTLTNSATPFPVRLPVFCRPIPAPHCAAVYCGAACSAPALKYQPTQEISMNKAHVLLFSALAFAAPAWG